MTKPDKHCRACEGTGFYACEDCFADFSKAEILKQIGLMGKALDLNLDEYQTQPYLIKLWRQMLIDLSGRVFPDSCEIDHDGFCYTHKLEPCTVWENPKFTDDCDEGHIRFLKTQAARAIRDARKE